MDTVNFLGISIVGQSNRGGDGGEDKGMRKFILEKACFYYNCVWIFNCLQVFTWAA
jgi:hypothetical protein